MRCIAIEWESEHLPFIVERLTKPMGLSKIIVGHRRALQPGIARNKRQHNTVVRERIS
jgi:hypothetical protein